jgi:hypothetical protein
MTKYYNHFIKRENAIKELFKKELYPKDIRNLTEKQFKTIENTVDCALSPENLYCDGEATQSEVNDKLEYYTMLCKEINANTSFKITELNY